MLHAIKKIQGIDPKAIQVMAEVGIDISSQKSKSTKNIKDMVFDQTRFVAGLKSVLDQLPEDLTGKKF